MAAKVERTIIPDEYKDRTLEFHEGKSKRTGCELSEWEERPPNRSIEEAPANTISVLVDTKGTGAFRIYKRKNNQEFEFLGGAGEDTPLVMIHWNPEWVFFCNGILRFRYILER